MLQELDDADRPAFEALLAELRHVGDLEKLSETNKALLKHLTSKYQAQQLDIDDQEQVAYPHIDLVTSSFGEFARQLLARHLNKQFSGEEDAVKYAFEQKFVPPELKDIDKVKEIFEQYKPDIVAANAWRDPLVDTESDPVLAVGLTWFMFIYQFKQRLSEA